MDNKQEWDAFSAELTRRLEEMEQWALQHWPDQSRPLSHADFSPLRYELSLLGARQKNPTLPEPEPSEGGAQYINMNPAPWP